jgi:UDPglucose 6-dehydrogenase
MRHTSISPVPASVAVIGCGHVGLVQAAGLASLGHCVVGVDRDAAHIARLELGEIRFHEPGLEALVRGGLASGRLSFTTQYERAASAEIVFVCVDTPSAPGGAADLTNLKSAVASVLGAMNGRVPILVNKSTAPIGTAEMIEALVAATGRRPRVAANPEFLRQAHAVEDFFEPNRIVVGARRAADAQAVTRLYAGIGGQRIQTDLRTAELIKYAANAFLATRISFVNELASLADAVGVQIDAVVAGVAADERIGAHFFAPGIGFGGSCLPKDTAALRHLGQSLGLGMPLLSAVIEANREARRGAVEALRQALGGIDGRTIAVWGLTFKGGTEDTRESPALEIVRMLQEEGATIRAFDPVDFLRIPEAVRGTLADSPLDAVRAADGLAILTDWKEFQSVSLAAVREAMRGDVIFDGRNILDPAEVAGHGLRYVGVGRPNDPAADTAQPTPLLALVADELARRDESRLSSRHVAA